MYKRGINVKRKLDVELMIGSIKRVVLTEVFPASTKELIYVANEENIEINHIFENHYKFLNKVAARYKLRFIYIPKLMQHIGDEEVQRYNFPYCNPVGSSSKFGNDFLLKYLAYPKLRNKLAHGLLLNDYTYPGYYDDKIYNYSYFPLSTNSNKSVAQQIIEVLQFTQIANNVQYELCGSIKEPSDSIADSNYKSHEWSDDLSDLMSEIREKVELLRKRGVAEQLLIDLLRPKEILSRLVVTEDFRLFLPDYQNIEIKMEPLVKAVYLLFLKHPEGIRFKDLPDYRVELTKLYIKMKPNGLTEKVLRSIEDVTNPLLNSINEKCARIRGAFVGQFDNRLAQYYYIDGRRCQPKAIALSRKLVEWKDVEFKHIEDSGVEDVEEGRAEEGWSIPF